MIIKDEGSSTFRVYLSDDGGEDLKPVGEFKSRQEARDFELSVTDFHNLEKDDVNLENETFDQLVRAFLEEKRVRVRESTYTGYCVVVNRFIRPFFAGKKARDITSADIRAWQNGMLKLSYSALYLHRVDSVMTGIFRYGMRFFGLERNPCDGVGGIGESVSRHINFWTLEEFTRFMTAVRGQRERLIFNMLYWTGMRLGELLALTPADTDLEANAVKVTKTYKRIHHQDVISPPKTKKSVRVIYIPDSLTAAVKTYISENPSITPNSRFFPVHVDFVRDSLTKAAKDAGVKRIKVHDIRHSHASLLINMNVTPLLVSERLGHEKVETTLNVYSHLYPDYHRKIAESLEDKFSNIRFE